jgi:hypothetical protein
MAKIEIDANLNKDEIIAKCCTMVKTCVDFKQARMNQIKEIEDMLSYKLQPALKGRLNVPFDGVIMNGFIDTLLSQTNKPPRVVFSDPKGSNLDGVKKTQALFDQDTSPQKGGWKRKDRMSKRLCAISNIGIFELHAESDPKYKSILNNIDHYDFIFDPNGGNNKEDFIYIGRTNVFKTEKDLDNPLYDKDQVAKIKAGYAKGDFKLNEDLYRNKVNRFNAVGLSIETANYVGQDLYNFTELEFSYNGTRYYALFDYKSKIWIRFDILKNIFESDLYSLDFWNAQENPFNIMGPGPADMCKVIAEAIRVNLNEVLNNNRKRNNDMRAVDKAMFPDISALDWRQDGVVQATVGINQSIQNGIYKFETPEISGALNLNAYLNNFVGVNSGISDQTKGESSQQTLGIAKLDDFNLSKRMKLIGDSYTECLASLVLMWDWNQWEHLDDEYAIKVLGKHGPELVNINKKDTEPDYNIAVLVSEDELAEDKITRENKAKALERITGNPELVVLLNKNWLLEQELRSGGWSDEEIKVGMNPDDSTAELISRLNKNIELILDGREPDDMPDTTTGTLQILHEYIVKNKKMLKPELIANLEVYFEKQSDYAVVNAKRAFDKQQIEQGMGQMEELGVGAGKEVVPPNNAIMGLKQ